jgi:hypothetical protein
MPWHARWPLLPWRSAACETNRLTILVDDPIWHWRDRRWCHLVSDTSLHELHEFARILGIPARGFHGDHYDVPEEHRELVVAAGAEQVTCRELLRRLRGAGLRLSPAQRRAGSVNRPSLGIEVSGPT